MVDKFDAAVSAEERLFCLLLALLPSDRGMSKADIFKNVRGYRDEFGEDGATDSLNKKFERDKEELKSMGIPLKTSEPDNPADAVYFIPSDEYTFSFSAAELSLLTAASAVWSESAHSVEASEARLRLLAADGVDSAAANLAPRIDTHDAAYPKIATAITKNQVVRFPYLKPGQAKYEVRTVTPLSVVNYDGRWHLLAFDHDREAERTFLLRRIVGKVAPVSQATPAQKPDTRAAGLFIEHLNELWDSLEATIRVTPGTKASVALANRRSTTIDGETYTIHYLDEAVLADELCEYGAEAIVLSPLSLRDAVIARLERLVDDHA
ncbi:MAG: WYL domain-containing protein [Microbacteriaceae bacterium]|nr:WYL domain-containing protein [Microbacteriaceae bacterium]